MRPCGHGLPGKESASNAGRQATEGSEDAPLWLVWGLGATLRPASTDAEARRRASWSHQVRLAHRPVDSRPAQAHNRGGEAPARGGSRLRCRAVMAQSLSGD